MDEDRARQLYVTHKNLEEQRQRLEKHLEEIQDKTLELQDMIDAVKELSSTPDDQPTLVPLTNGVFFTSNSHDTKRLYLNVGAGVVVKRTPQQAQELLSRQQDELAQFREQVLKDHEQLSGRITQLEKRIESEVEDV